MRIYLLLLCLLSLPSLAHGQSIKMKIATVTPAEGEDVIAFEGSDTVATTSASNGGSSAGKPRFEFFKIKKLAGPSTNELFKRSIAGTHTADVTFEFNDSNGILFYKISLKDVVLGHFSYLSPECANCGRLYHQIWMDFTKIELTDVATGNVLAYDRTINKF